MTAAAAMSAPDVSHSVERGRERQFYKYYDPIRALCKEDPPWVDAFDEEAAKQHVPRSSPDHALTAFCQLGALRLNARRGLLFFFDRDKAYVMAEGTKTTSLLNDQIHQDPEDSLWLGNCRIPRGALLCEQTMNLPASECSPNRPHAYGGNVFVVNDLESDPEFQERPFVTGGPQARFYAGVPLTTASGVRIGVYCVLDDKPREGLRAQDVDFLSEMSKTVMAHLEMVHVRTEFSRQTRMLTGLNTFVKDITTSGPGPPRNRPASELIQASPHPDDRAFDQTLPTESTPHRRSHLKSPKSKAQHASTDVQDFASDSESEGADRRSVGQAQKRFDKQMDKDSGAGAQRVLRRAADVIRDAVDADGVMFLDATSQIGDGSSSFGGSGDDRATTTDASAEHGSDDSFQKSQNADCRTLGVSCRNGSLAEAPRVQMRERFLKTLLRRHAQGKVWTFNSEGEVSSTEEGTSDDPTKSEKPKDHQRRRAYRKSGVKSTEAQRIQECFPHARAVCLVPVWDPVRERWFAGAFMWTYSPLRVFSPEGETAYLMAFCDVVMAKISKREAKKTDKAKSDFISSVSHELRSPLHGILGSLELLQERDSVDRMLLGQIEKCSTTLLDIVEHLLDFAKLDHHVSRSKISGTRHRKLPSMVRRDSQATVALSQSNIKNEPESLSKLVEDVADAAFYSHCCTLEEDSKSAVDFVLDISTGPEVRIKDEVGAWKRLVMNLINNALKFTDSGHVAVSLKSLSRKRKRKIAILSVSDTGCGMSQEFLAHGLFRAFSQENGLTTGTGLGLSVVAKLVNGLGGKIDVQSEKGAGSSFTIAIPLESGIQDENAPSSTALEQPARIGLLRPGGNGKEQNASDDGDSARQLHMTGIQSSCRRIGAELTSLKSANLNLVFAEDLKHLRSTDEQPTSLTGSHLIVLCQTLSSAIEMQSARQPVGRSGHVEYIAQPFGPIRLRAAINNCLLADSQRDSTANGEVAKYATSLLNTLPSHLRRSSSESLSDSSTRASSLPPTILRSNGSRMEISEEGAMLLQEKLADAAPSIEAPELKLRVRERTATLPPTPPESAGSPEPQTPMEIETAQPKNFSLLLVDDNPINLRLLTAFADKNKHPRLTATNGQEAVTVYRTSAMTGRPDVVFLDINMPVLNGFQAARQIRAFEKEMKISPTFLIALTCLGSEHAKAEAEACGIDMFLTKPVRPRDLKGILERVGETVEEQRRDAATWGVEVGERV